jgi:putative ABC transport system ATP-binding protein
MPSLCEIVHVTRTYGSGATAVRAVDDVDLRIEPGEFTAFVGPSGSGKTTLLNQVGCLDRPSSGEIRLEGRSTSGLSDPELAALRARRIGFIFQSFNLIPVLTAAENVELALQLAGLPAPRADTERLLQQVGLADLGNRRPNQLSGGQQQRVAVARALVKKPALVIADEPTANLDSSNGEAILDLMRQLNAELGITFLFSTHDPMVMGHARRIVTLHDGKVRSDEWKSGGGAAAAPPAAAAGAGSGGSAR